MLADVILVICFSELKRRQKAEQKEKEKLEKAQNAAAVAKEKPAASKPDKLNEEDISPNEYFKLRSAAVAELKRKFYARIDAHNFQN